MDILKNKFKTFLIKDGRSELTVKNYITQMNLYFKWFEESKGVKFTKLHRENVLDYISYIRNVLKVKRGKNKEQPLSTNTVNVKISALIKFNEFLLREKKVKEMVVTKEDLVSTQTPYFSLSKIDVDIVEKFRQIVLDKYESVRNYAIVTVLAYSGLRISECLDLKDNFDVNYVTREIVVRKGKGDKSRTVFMNDKTINALKSWDKERKEKKIESEYVFVSRNGNRLDRTVVNRMFNERSKELGIEVTPHDLRHFFCSYLINQGFPITEVKFLAGHKNIHTTMIYSNPTERDMKERMKSL